jgi:hypothetical protein
MAVKTHTTTVSEADARRSRHVWLVILLCNALFLVLCVTLANTTAEYLSSITVPQTATFELKHGSQLAVLRQGSRVPELVTDRTQLREHDVALTGPDSEGFIQFFDGTSTIQTYFSTTLTIETLRTARFFQTMKEARIRVDSGTVVWATGDPGGYASVEYNILSENAEISIPGNSKVRVRVEKDDQNETTTHVIVEYGSAVLLSRGRRIEVGREHMAWVGPQGISPEPVRAEEELIRNGSFTEPPTSGAETRENGGLDTAAWLPIREAQTDLPLDIGSVSVITETLPGVEGIRALRLCLRDSEDCPAQHASGDGQSADRYVRVGVRQEINRPVEFFNSIELSAAVKVVRQSLPAGGPQGNLFPLTIRVLYSDSERNQHEWRHSFYYFTSERSGSGLPDATRVPEASWWLPEQKFVLKSADVGRDIAVINAIEIFGYGKQFKSQITRVSMVAR